MEEKEVRKKKVNHRGHNEGSIFQRADGVWVGQIQIGFKPDGRRKFTTKTSKSRKEIADWLTESRNDILKNSFIEPNSMTVEDWLWNWMVTYKLKNVSSNTYARYLNLLNIHIIPAMKNVKLKNLKAIQIQNFFNDCKESGMSASAIKHVKTIFNQALECAFRENLIPKNWTEYTVLPKARSKEEVSVFTPEEQEKIIKNIPFSPLGVLIRLAIATGAREGELLGMHWSDIDFENKVINIAQSLGKKREFSADGRSVISTENAVGDLKTLHSKRVIPITDSVIDLLKKYRAKQNQFIKLPDNTEILPSMVFLNASGGYWDNSNAIKQYRRFLKSLGIPYRKFHTLRHTFATRIMEANVHPKIAQELLGHSTVNITMNIYSHVLPEQKREAIEKIKGIV